MVSTITEEEAVAAGVRHKIVPCVLSDGGVVYETNAIIPARDMFGTDWDKHNPKHPFSEARAWFVVLKKE
jgi:hypothetical protein